MLNVRRAFDAVKVKKKCMRVCSLEANTFSSLGSLHIYEKKREKTMLMDKNNLESKVLYFRDGQKDLNTHMPV